MSVFSIILAIVSHVLVLCGIIDGQPLAGGRLAACLAPALVGILFAEGGLAEGRRRGLGVASLVLCLSTLGLMGLQTLA